MSRGPNVLGPKWVRAQMSRGPNELGPKCVGAQMSRGPNESGPKWVGAQMCWGPNESGPKCVGAQMSWGPNVLGPKWVRGPNEWGPNESGAQMRNGPKCVPALSSGGARTHTTRGMENFSLFLYQLSYQGLMLGEAILLRNILISIFLIIFHHYLIFLETRPSWKGQ